MVTLKSRSFFAGFQTRQSLVLENLALRHQVQLLKRGGKRPRIKGRDRALWVLLSRCWRGWRTSILIVQPDTVIKWHRSGFRAYWRFKSQRRRCGRPRLTLDERELIRNLARQTPCGVLPAFDAPVGAWAAERVIEALDFKGAPTLLLRDRDQKFGEEFDARLDEAGIRQVLSAHRCPWQNGYAERAIGTLRRECLDHVIIFHARHLRAVLEEYVAYYNESRTHLGIEKDCPVPRVVEKPDDGEIVALPVLGGLHHRYTRRAA